MKCLCPVFQKYYNALKSINELKTNNNFFDNIASIDNFFLEFRNITFVLQKQLKSEEEKDTYERLKLKYLNNDTMKWFVETRNEVSKESSFELKKKIIVDVYCIHSEKNIINETFTIQDEDLTSEQVKTKIEEKLSKIKTREPEIFLTIKYLFLNKSEEIDIYEMIKKGLNIMHDFVFELEESINSDCRLCKKLKKSILEKTKEFSSRRMELITDCSYNVKKNKLEFYDKADILYGTKSDNFFLDNYRMPIKDNPIFPRGGNLDEVFESFIIMHILIYIEQQKHIMPTFVIIYKDMTFTIDSFFVFTKATLYRKVNEISKKVLADDIIAIMSVGESLAYPIDDTNIYEKPYEERIKNATEERLVFTMIKDNIEEKTIWFDTNRIEDMIYVRSKLNKNDKSFFDLTLQPIREMFLAKKQSN